MDFVGGLAEVASYAACKVLIVYPLMTAAVTRKISLPRGFGHEIGEIRSNLSNP